MSTLAHVVCSYYQTRRFAAHDERLALLPTDFFRGKTVLDIGCNEGWVSCEIAQAHGASRVLGVDIDSALVASAWKRRKHIWSLCAPPTPSSSPDAPAVSEPASTPVHEKKKKRKRAPEHAKEHAMSAPAPHDTHFELERPYFPVSMRHLFGPLPIPPLEAIEAEPDPNSSPGTELQTQFPYNVAFRTSDWLSEPRIEQFDIILALSITKWIHLNHGDAGLERFFQKIYDSLTPHSGAKLVLEPQHWEGYAKAKRMDAKLKENAKTLTLRPDDFPALLEKIGFMPVVKKGEVGEGGLRRPVDVYEKP